MPESDRAKVRASDCVLLTWLRDAVLSLVDEVPAVRRTLTELALIVFSI